MSCERNGQCEKAKSVLKADRWPIGLVELSEHQNFEAAYRRACELFDEGMEDDFVISSNDGVDIDVRIPNNRLVKQPCAACGNETRAFDLILTLDCHGIPYRRVCQHCYERIMDEKGYDGELYDAQDENLDYDD